MTDPLDRIAGGPVYSQDIMHSDNYRCICGHPQRMHRKLKKRICLMASCHCEMFEPSSE